MTTASTLELLAPTAVVRLALVSPAGDEHPPPSALVNRFLDHTGVYKLQSGLLVVAPSAGDEGVFDAAAIWAQGLEREWASAGSSRGEQGLSTIVFPGVATLKDGTADLLEDFLIDDLRRQAPGLGPGIFLTGRAAKMLEYPRHLDPAPEYEGPSGKAVALFRLGRPLERHLPWRNPEVFEHATPFAERRHLQDALSSLLEETVTRVSGPLGCGKTRLVWENLAVENQVHLWLRARPERVPTPTLAEQVIRHLLLPSDAMRRDPLHPDLAGEVNRADVEEVLAKRAKDPSHHVQLGERALAALEHLGAGRSYPVFLVVDDFHLATRTDTEFISRLLSARHLGLGLRIVLVGRSGSPWPQELEPFPVLEVPPLSPAEMGKLTSWITEGLSIPAAIRDRFIASVHGYPFAFEEGLFALIHERHLRRIYGSFFFGGDESTEFQPSHRFVRHVEAEIARLGAPLPIRLLSLIDMPVPAAELASAASIFGARVEPGWEEPLLDARILVRAESPWGPGVRIVSPVISNALARSFTEESTSAARHQLGELLALSGQSGKAHWNSYRLLAGSPEALEPLLQVFKTSYASQIPRERLLEALTLELRLVRDRSDDQATELQLLWRLLPLARREGRLASYEEDLQHGIKLARAEPKKLLALASVKAEMEEESGRHSMAQATIQDALKSAANIEARRKALLMIQLGRLFLRQNRHAEAEQLFSNLRRAFDESDSSAMAATCLFHLGNIALRAGRLEEAIDRHQEALDMRRAQNLLRQVGSSLTALGTVTSAVGNYPKALEYYQEAQEVLEENGGEGEVSFALLGAARTLSRIGDFSSATGPVRRALSLREGRDDATGEAIARLAVARNHLDLGRADIALEEARKAHFQLSMISAEVPLAEADKLLGRIHLKQRRFEDARRRLEGALARYRTQQDRSSATFVIASLINVCLSLEDEDGIRRYTTELKNVLNDSPPADLREVLHFRLFQGLDWLASQGHKVGHPTSFLEKAYRSVLRKAAHLTHEVRQRYLYQVPEIRAIVEAATRKGLDEKVRRGEDFLAAKDE
jgi:tetratricopeptide (TPR) repeat protein